MCVSTIMEERWVLMLSVGADVNQPMMCMCSCFSVAMLRHSSQKQLEEGKGLFDLILLGPSPLGIVLPIIDWALLQPSIRSSQYLALEKRFLQRIQVQFSAPSWQFTTIGNSSSRVSDALSWPPWAQACIWSTYIHAGKISTHINLNKDNSPQTWPQTHLIWTLIEALCSQGTLGCAKAVIKTNQNNAYAVVLLVCVRC